MNFRLWTQSAASLYLLTLTRIGTWRWCIVNQFCVQLVQSCTGEDEWGGWWWRGAVCRQGSRDRGRGELLQRGEDQGRGAGRGVGRHRGLQVSGLRPREICDLTSPKCPSYLLINNKSSCWQGHNFKHQDFRKFRQKRRGLWRCGIKWWEAWYPS